MPLVFYEKTHEYFLNGFNVPSVSSLLEPLTNGTYRDVPSEILNAAAERGTAVHKATEHIDNGIEFEFSEGWFPYIDAYMNFKKEHETKWLILFMMENFYRRLYVANTLEKTNRPKLSRFLGFCRRRRKNTHNI